MTHDRDHSEAVRRQRSRALGFALLAFVILLFLITVARLGAQAA